jgi:hypothetical protein
MGPTPPVNDLLREAQRVSTALTTLLKARLRRADPGLCQPEDVRRAAVRLLALAEQILDHPGDDPTVAQP